MFSTVIWGRAKTDGFKEINIQAQGTGKEKTQVGKSFDPIKKSKNLSKT